MRTTAARPSLRAAAPLLLAPMFACVPGATAHGDLPQVTGHRSIVPGKDGRGWLVAVAFAAPTRWQELADAGAEAGCPLYLPRSSDGDALAQGLLLEVVDAGLADPCDAAWIGASRVPEAGGAALWRDLDGAPLGHAPFAPSPGSPRLVFAAGFVASPAGSAIEWIALPPGPSAAGNTALALFHAAMDEPDADADGMPDRLAAALLRRTPPGTSAPPCPDLNADGFVDAADLAILLAAWGTPGPGDLDGDGIVGATDLSALLAAW